MKDIVHQDALDTAQTYNEHGEMYHSTRTQGLGRFTNEYIDIPATFSLCPRRAPNFLRRTFLQCRAD